MEEEEDLNTTLSIRVRQLLGPVWNFEERPTHPLTHSLNADHVEAFNPNNMISGWVVGWMESPD